MIKLGVLGRIHLAADDGVEIESLLRQPKRLALLAYLASPAPGTWHRRDTLLALFWPELDTPHARTSLRNGLYTLRQALGDEVLRTRGDEEISVDPDRLGTDLALVWDALKRNAVDDAIERYGGDLLPGLYPPDSEGFQRWLESERTRLSVALSAAAMVRLDDLVKAGENSKALDIARKLIAINPDDETIVRRVMTLNNLLGDRVGALSVFEMFRVRLARDFAADPSPETMSLVESIRSASTTPPARKPPPQRRDPVARDGEVADPAASELRIATPAVTPVATQTRFPYWAAIAAGIVTVVTVGAFALKREPLPSAIGRSTPLTTDEGLQVEVALSPNGRLVAYAKGNSSHLRIFVQKIGGGDPWPLTTDSTNGELMPRWSPDNDQVLFLARNNAYAAPSIGGAPRLLARGSEGNGMIRSASWSPAGDSIVVVRNDSLLVLPLRGTGSRFVGRGTQLHSCVWSPAGVAIACISGNWIAFVPGPLFGNNAPSSIVVFPAAGGEPVNISGNNDENQGPAWSADGKFLWFLSNRDGVQGDAYSVAVDRAGRASRNLVRVGLRAESISLSAGRIAYSVSNKKANVWRIPIPRDSAVSIALAWPLTAGNQIAEVVSTSPDGNWLTYDSNLRGNADIYRIRIGSGADAEPSAPELLTDDPRPEYAAELSPDGTEIAWQRWVNGERHLFVKRLDADDASEIMPVPGDQGVPRWSADGKWLAAWSHDTETGAIFVLERDGSGHWRRPLWRLNFGQLPVWSPDNKYLAFVRLDGAVQLIPRDSGAVKTVYAPKPASGEPQATFLTWREPDQIWMLGHGRNAQGIWSLSLRTGRPRLLVRMDNPIGKTIGPAFSADKSNFYFALSERFSNVQIAELVRR